MEPSSSADALIIEDLAQQKLPARYLAALLRRTDLCVRLVDLNDGADALIALAKRVTPRLIISSILFADRVEEHLALMTALRAVCPRARLALAGHLPAFAAAELRAACPALDSVLCGEAEAITYASANVARQAPPRELEPLAPPACAGGASPRKIPCAMIPFDALPFPARDDGITAYLGYGFATIEASRGCYHACAFCLPSAYYRARTTPYCLRRVTDLVDEIESLYRQGARLFLFDDEQFLPPQPARTERVAEFANELARRGLHIAFTLKCRADDVDVPLFRQLQEIGLLRVYIGIESGDPATLELYNKHVTVQQNANALATLNGLGIVADFRALIFHPWSTLESICAEITFLRNVLPHCSTAFDFREVEIYPGTPLATRLRDEARCDGTVWQMRYALADPRAERVRRLCHRIFSESDVYRNLQDALTREWYAYLLTRWFHSSASDAERARPLKAIAARANSESLFIWQEMLEFANEGEDYDARQVNARADAWMARLNSI